MAPGWIELALDAVEAARDRLSLSEYNSRAKLAVLSNGLGYNDRVNVCDRLIREGVICIEGGLLALGKIDSAEWIMSGLEQGSSPTWRIAEIVDRRGRFLKKFDSESLAHIGKIGEDAVVECLRKSLPGEAESLIRHVSLVDDSLGYDIESPALRNPGWQQLLEVKTSVRPGPAFRCYLSRNEHRVGQNNSNWSLICVRVVDGVPQILGYLKMGQIADLLPVDVDPSAKWESCRVDLDLSLLTPGLP